MVDIGIAAEPVFEEGGKKGKLGIENVPGNRYSLQIDLVLDDTGETIYQSGLIDPGYYIEYVELNKTLKAENIMPLQYSPHTRWMKQRMK